MELILQVFYSIFSGLLLAIAIPNELYLLGCPVFTLLAFIPYYIAFYKIKDYRQAFLCGFLQSITTHLVSSYWLAYFKDFAALTLGASAVGTGFIGGFFGLFLYLPYADSKSQNKLNEAALHKGLTSTVTFRILYFAAMYVVYEWVKSNGFLGYPWGTVSSAAYKWQLLTQISSITGRYGVTFVITLFNAICAEYLIHYYRKNYQNDSRRYTDFLLVRRLFLVIISVSLIYGFYQYQKIRKPIKKITTVLVQQNSNPWDEKDDNASILKSEELTKNAVEELKKNNKSPDLVVWSEGCLRYKFPSSENHYKFLPEEKPLADFVEETGTPFIFGGSYVKDAKEHKYNNATIVYDSQGRFRGYYGKNHLVPFAEALPFVEYPKIKDFMKKVVGISAGWAPGDQYVYFDIAAKKTQHYREPAVKYIDIQEDYAKQNAEENKGVTVRIATPICFDDSFMDILRPMFLNGAELFVNITDDSWSLTRSSEMQHFVIASYAAIEYRTTMVRSANAGYSVVLDPTGKILWDMPLFQATSTSFEVPVYKRQITTYARFGNWFPHIFVILFFIYAFYSFRTFVKDDYIPSERKIKNSKKKKASKKSDKKSKKKK